MSYATRILLVAAALETLALPVVTAHTFVLHPEWLRSSGIRWALADPAATIIITLTLIAAIPTIRLCNAAWQWRRLGWRVAAVTEYGVPRSHRGISYVYIPGERVAFFTAGFWKPTIYVTAAAEEQLAAGPFLAALLHEQAHVRRRDVRWLALTAAVEKTFAFVPWTAGIFGGIRLRTERVADLDALAAGAARTDLFEAIVSASSPRGVAALSEAGVEQRLRWLADDHEALPSLPSRGATALLGGMAVPPTLAHAVMWIGFVCAICTSHVVH